MAIESRGDIHLLACYLEELCGIMRGRGEYSKSRCLAKMRRIRGKGGGRLVTNLGTSCVDDKYIRTAVELRQLD